jgi:hypothetical protein
MAFEGNPLEELARRARGGDPAAAEQFRLEMSLALEGMVRLALRKRICFSRFDEHARAQADRLQESGNWQLADDELARQTAARVCQDMIARLQAGGPVQDTVACVGAGGDSSKHRTVVSSPRSGTRAD